MKLMQQTLFALVALTALSTAWASDVMVMDPWVREGPPNAPALAGYMVLMNHSNQDKVLTGAASPAFGMVMLHRTVMEGGMARMVHQESITIPAQGKLVFEANSYHLMLMQPKVAPKAGDQIAITLQFADGESMAVNFPVRAGGMQMQHHDMQHMH